MVTKSSLIRPHRAISEPRPHAHALVHLGVLLHWGNASSGELCSWPLASTLFLEGLSNGVQGVLLFLPTICFQTVFSSCPNKETSPYKACGTQKGGMGQSQHRARRCHLPGSSGLPLSCCQRSALHFPIRVSRHSSHHPGQFHLSSEVSVWIISYFFPLAQTSLLRGSLNSGSLGGAMASLWPLH